MWVESRSLAKEPCCAKLPFENWRACVKCVSHLDIWMCVNSVWLFVCLPEFYQRFSKMVWDFLFPLHVRRVLFLLAWGRWCKRSLDNAHASMRLTFFFWFNGCLVRAGEVEKTGCNTMRTSAYTTTFRVKQVEAQWPFAIYCHVLFVTSWSSDPLMKMNRHSGVWLRTNSGGEKKTYPKRTARKKYVWFVDDCYWLVRIVKN